MVFPKTAKTGYGQKTRGFENLKSGTALLNFYDQTSSMPIRIWKAKSAQFCFKTYVAFNGYIDGITAGATYDR